MKMKEITTLEKLKEVAIAIKEDLTIYLPELNEEKELKPQTNSTLKKLEKGYRVGNGTITFVSENVQYAIPYMRQVIEILVENGFKQKYMIKVPFSKSKYPTESKEQWEELIKMAEECCLQEFIDDCNKFCDEHEFGIIKDELIEKCFEIPKFGVHVREASGEDIYYYPAIIRSYLDYTAVEKLGKYSIKNGVVAFVYRNGKTYVTPNQKVLEAIRKADFIEEEDMIVPFANGEKIYNQGYANLWKKICEQS